MDDILFEVLKLIVMVAVFLVTTFLVPWLKNKIGADKIAQIEKWVNAAVLSAQQTKWDQSGEDRKKAVVQFVQKMCAEHNIKITDEQIDILIEAAVKQMKIDEGIKYDEDKGRSASPEKDGADKEDSEKAKTQG